MHFMRGLAGQRLCSRIGSRGFLNCGKSEESVARKKTPANAGFAPGSEAAPSSTPSHPQDPYAHSSSPSLQFSLEEFVPAVEAAFRRVVCLPFHTAVASNTSRFERKVRQVLMELVTRCGDVDLEDMAAQLLSHGLRAVVTYPAKPQARAPLTTRAISLPFLVVSLDGSGEVVVVDPTLREHLAVAPATPAYSRTLAADVPEVFIGTPARLADLVAAMADAICLNFRSQGVEVPPWRRKAALLSRWSVLGGLESRQPQSSQLKPQHDCGGPQHTDPHQQPHWCAHAGASGQPAFSAQQHACAQAAPTHLASPSPSQQQQQRQEQQRVQRLADVAVGEDSAALHAKQVAGEGQVHGGCCMAPQPAAQPAMRIILGFELGSRFPGEQGCAEPRAARSAGFERKSGGLSNLCRHASSVVAESSSTSIEALGASPLSVFRDE